MASRKEFCKRGHPRDDEHVNRFGQCKLCLKESRKAHAERAAERHAATRAQAVEVPSLLEAYCALVPMATEPFGGFAGVSPTGWVALRTRLLAEDARPLDAEWLEGTVDGDGLRVGGCYGAWPFAFEWARFVIAWSRLESRSEWVLARDVATWATQDLGLFPWMASDGPSTLSRRFGHTVLKQMVGAPCYGHRIALQERGPTNAKRYRLEVV